MTDTVTSYQRRRNEALFARQAPAVQKIIKEILKELKTIEQSVYWAIDSDDSASDMWPESLIEHAHALLDLGHDYRAALKANPPLKDEENAA
jgi:hypothetical protein